MGYRSCSFAGATKPEVWNSPPSRDGDSDFLSFSVFFCLRPWVDEGLFEGTALTEYAGPLNRRFDERPLSYPYPKIPQNLDHGLSFEARKVIPKNLSSQVLGEVRVNFLGWNPTKTLYFVNRRSELFRKFLGRFRMILCNWKTWRRAEGVSIEGGRVPKPS